MEKAKYVDRVAIREKVCTGCTMLVDGVCCDADPCENLIAGFLEEPPADVVPAHRKENAHSIPLTLDELRQMDGEPVWVQFLHNKIGYWYLIDCHNSEFIRFYRSGFFINGEYSKSFLAYRRKSEEDKHETV